MTTQREILKPIEWDNGIIKMLDQRILPGKEVIMELTTIEELAVTIKELAVRGAPAIGVSAAMGMILPLFHKNNNSSTNELKVMLEQAGDFLSTTRPTAVNLFWAIDRMKRKATECSNLSPSEFIKAMEKEAIAIHEEDIESCLKIGEFGSTVVPDNSRILTHCNAGALATGGYGTALGVIRGAHERGKKVSVFADETRPLLQGARLTCWELMKDGIETRLITDNMAGYLMSKGEIDLVVVGADRIAGNGDTANKIGTYSVAVLAKENNMPFYVAAPYSTLDLSLESGNQIPIEERDAKEVYSFMDSISAPEGVLTRNPAFDVTPAKYIKAIITDKGIIEPPFKF